MVRYVMPRASIFIALLAAIMLVIGGTPALASCDPCPPDCPMMKAMASGDMKAPAHPEKSAKSCSMAALCQTVAAAPALPDEAVVVWFAPQALHHPLANTVFALSRPPDKALRPPIQL